VQVDSAAPHSNAGEQLSGIEGLGQIVVGAGRQTFHDVVFFRDAGQHDDVGIGMLQISANVLAKLKAGEIGHHPIGDNDARSVSRIKIERLPAVLGKNRQIRVVFKRMFHQFAINRRIIDDQDTQFGHSCSHALSQRNPTVLNAGPEGRISG